MSKTFNVNGNTVMPGVNFDLANAIDATHTEANLSPIDHFFVNAAEINTVMLPGLSPVLGNLIILGYISAIESYFRALFRRVIFIDSISKGSCEKKQLTYGAVMSIDSKTLPEALFEDISFAGKKNILTSVKEFLGVNIQESSMSADLRTTLDQFSEICELRHCIVHRFGKFGSKNAINLGLDKYLGHVEKPIKCDFVTLQHLVPVCHNTARIMNNFLFEKILTRLIIDSNIKIVNPIWTWDYQRDKALWKSYFDSFYSAMNPMVHLTPHSLYLRYRTFYNTL